MLILSTKLKNRFTLAHNVVLKNIRVNADVRGCSGFIALNGAIVYVNTERVRILAIHRAGTIDVQRSDGACYRVSGLSMVKGAGL